MADPGIKEILRLITAEQKSAERLIDRIVQAEAKADGIYKKYEERETELEAKAAALTTRIEELQQKVDELEEKVSEAGERRNQTLDELCESIRFDDEGDVELADALDEYEWSEAPPDFSAPTLTVLSEEDFPTARKNLTDYIERLDALRVFVERG